MTAPIRITPDTIEGYEVYRIVLDYEALHEGFIDRVDDLKVTRTGIDVAGGFAPGYSAKVLCNPPMKFLGRDSLGRDGLGKMLKATGMALVLVIDDERFAAVKATMALSKRPRKPAIAGSVKPTWLFTKKKAREMGKKRFASMSDSERKRHQRKAGKASGKARRRKAKSGGALLAQVGVATVQDDHSSNTKVGCCQAAGDQAPLRAASQGRQADAVNGRNQDIPTTALAG